MTLIRQRYFVFTLLWIGFILAISFMEAPLKFQAESVTVPIGLEIGYLVFHALNGMEIVFAVVITAVTLTNIPSVRIRNLTLFIAGWLIIQTLLLYGPLDRRTLARISGADVPEAPFHLIYIGMELVKLGLLLVLAHLQINHFVFFAKNSKIHQGH